MVTYEARSAAIALSISASDSKSSPAIPKRAMALFGMAGEDFESEADMDRAIAALLASYVTIAPLTDS